MTTRQDRYTSIAVALHWLIALSILFQIMLGWRMDDNARSASTYLVFQLHKSIGITILLLSLARLGWRLANPPPPLPAHLKPWEKGLAQLTHIGFYLIMIGLPITGWIMVSASKTNIPTLLYGVIPWPHIPGIAELAPAAKHGWRSIGEAGHGLLAKLTYLLLALHVAGALKHQLVDRDSTLARMIPGVRAGAWFDPRAVVLALLAVGALAAGQLIFRTAAAPPPASPVPAPVAPAPEPVAPAPASPAPAADAAKLPAAPAMPAARWIVDSASTLGFTATWSGQPITGTFKQWKAEITFSEDDLAHSSIKVTVDPASASTGDAQRDQTLPTEDWFSTAKFPSAVFAAQHFRRKGSDFIADGSLTLKGVTRPVQLRFSLKTSGDQAAATGQAPLDRTAFGVGQGDFAGTDQIPAAVVVNVAIKAHKAR